MSNAWFIRISRDYEEIKEWVEWIPAQEKIAVQHDADEEVNRTHTHILVIGCSLQKQSIKTKLERMCGKFTKGDWAFPEYEDNKEYVMTYMSKGCLDYEYIHGFEVDWSDIKSKWVEPKKLQTTMTNYMNFKKKEDIATYKDMVNRVIILCESDNDISTDNILAKIRQVFIKENQCIIGRYKVRDIVDTIMARIQPASWQDSLKRFCEYRT